MDYSHGAEEENKRASFAKKKNICSDFVEKNLLNVNYHNSVEKISNYVEDGNFAENIFIINEKLEKCAMEILKSGQKSSQKKYSCCEEELMINLMGEDTLPSTANKSRRDSIHSIFRNKILINIKPNEFYEGEVDENQLMSGFGTYHYENGDTYEGEFLKGLKSGQGEYNYADGSSYIGEWLNDKKHGVGTFKFKVFEITGHWDQDEFINGFNEKPENLFEEKDEEILSENENNLEKSFSLYENKFGKIDESTEHNDEYSFEKEESSKSSERLNTSTISEDEEDNCEYDFDAFITNDLYYEIEKRQSYTLRTSINIQQILKNN
jgi:hypothetical protein